MKSVEFVKNIKSLLKTSQNLCYNLIVKKFAIILLIGILLTSMLIFGGCHDKNDNKNKTFFITISFDTNGIECTCPEPVTVEVSGTCLNIGLPIPDDAAEYAGHELAWFTDPECKKLFSVDEVPKTDITLYLGYAPKTYHITYTNKDAYDFEGEFAEYYVYGEGVALPNVNLGAGFQQQGNWYYGEGEKDFYTTSVPKTVYGDLVLTFKPNPIKFEIRYELNLPDNLPKPLPNGVKIENPNPAFYDVTMGKVYLLPLTVTGIDGLTFSHWEYRNAFAKTRKIEYLDLDLLSEFGMNFSLWAVWKYDENAAL